MRSVFIVKPRRKSIPGNVSKGLTRRNFLKMAVGGVAGSAIVALGVESFATNRGMGVGAQLATNSAPMAVLQSLEKSEFDGRVGDIFSVQKDTLEVVDLELVEVIEYSPGLRERPTEAYSLMFRGPSGHALSQGTYTVHNRSIGAFPLFMVPMRSDGSEPHYEAIFNRV